MTESEQVVTYDGKYDLCIKQGVPFYQTIEVIDETTGLSVDLTGATVVAKAKRLYSDATEVFHFDYSIYQNVITISMTAAQTAAIPVDAATDVNKKDTLYCYDIDVTLLSGVVYRVGDGLVYVSPEVSR